MSRPVPEWSVGRPEKSGVYLGFSDHRDRTDDADIYSYDKEKDLWQHHTGWYDHLISHWILLKAND